jgi:hypothetical protein
MEMAQRVSEDVAIMAGNCLWLMFQCPKTLKTFKESI